MSTSKLFGKPNSGDGLASRPGFMLQKPGLAPGSYDPVGSKASHIILLYFQEVRGRVKNCLLVGSTTLTFMKYNPLYLT